MFSNKKIVMEVRVVFQTSHCSDIFWVCICLREVVEDYFHITFFLSTLFPLLTFLYLNPLVFALFLILFSPPSP